MQQMNILQNSNEFDSLGNGIVLTSNDQREDNGLNQLQQFQDTDFQIQKNQNITDPTQYPQANNGEQLNKDQTYSSPIIYNQIDKISQDLLSSKRRHQSQNNGGGIIQWDSSVGFRNRAASAVSGRRKLKHRKKHHGNTLDSGWNENFQIVKSQINQTSHPYYKEFFDKPSRRHDDKLTMSIILESRKSLQSDLERFKQEARIPLNSSACNWKHIKNEGKWNKDFQVMASKNNQELHSSQKEFYDRPIVLSKNGYIDSLKYPPLSIYHKMTPVKTLEIQVFQV
eukprot:403369971